MCVCVCVCGIFDSEKNILEELNRTKVVISTIVHCMNITSSAQLDCICAVQLLKLEVESIYLTDVLVIWTSTSWHSQLLYHRRMLTF